MTYEQDRIQAVQDKLNHCVPDLETEVVFDGGLGAYALRVQLPGDCTEQYLTHKGYWWAQFAFVADGPFSMPPSSRRSPYRDVVDPMSMAMWIAATVGQYDTLFAYPTEPTFTEISEVERKAAWARIDVLATFLMQTHKGGLPSSEADRTEAGKLLDEYMVKPYMAWKKKKGR